MQLKLLEEDPISLHKYLYANANPVSNSDPTGYSALVGGITAGGILSDVEAKHNTAVMKIFAKLMVKLNAIALFMTTYQIQISLVMLLVVFATGVATGGLGIPEDIQRQIEAIVTVLFTYGIGQCYDFAKDLADKFLKSNISGEVLILVFSAPYVYSKKLGGYTGGIQISLTGKHVGVSSGITGMVHCVIHPLGLFENNWINDFEGSLPMKVVRVTFKNFITDNYKT